jgi:hypothetical protein
MATRSGAIAQKACMQGHRQSLQPVAIQSAQGITTRRENRR